MNMNPVVTLASLSVAAICLYVAYLVPTPSYAAEAAAPAAVCEAPLSVLSDTLAVLEAKGIKFKVLTAEERALFIADLRAAYTIKTGEVASDMASVTDVLIAIMRDEVFFGLVSDGCLSPPAALADYLPAEKRSGYTPVGTFA